MPLPQRSGSSGDSQIWVSHLQKGHREEEREAGVFLQGKSEHSHHSHLLTLNLRQKSRKQPGGKATWVSPGDTCLGEGGQSLLPQCLHTGQLGAPSCWWASRDSLPGQVAPASGLEVDDDIGIFRFWSSSRWARTVAQRKPCSGPCGTGCSRSPGP